MYLFEIFNKDYTKSVCKYCSSYAFYYENIYYTAYIATHTYMCFKF